MYKPNSSCKNNSDGEELTPEEMEAAIALYKAQKAASQAAGGEGIDGDNPETEDPVEDKTPIEQVRENIDRRDAEGSEMTLEDIIAAQKADLDTLLTEIDKLQASNDMNDDDDQSPTDGTADSEPDESNTDSDAGAEADIVAQEPDKKVNADSVDQLVKDRLDVCRMADKLHLDGVEGLSVLEGRKRIIKAVNPKINLDGKSSTYITAAYDIAKQSFHERKSTNDQRKKMFENQARKDSKEACGSDAARTNMIKRMKGGNK